MKLHFLCAVALLTGPLVLAEDSAEREKLNGSWQAQGPGQGVWTFEPQGATLRITNSQGSVKIVEIACELAKECEVKEAGKKIKVMVYFNGPKLVLMETRGDQILKRRFGFAGAEDILELENIPVAPAGKSETVHFTRVQSAAVAKP